jgi:hypothetical protein
MAVVHGTITAVHLRDDGGFSIFSLEPSDGIPVRVLGHLPPEVGLRAVVRVGSTWARHIQYGWQVRLRTAELVDRLDRRGVIAFLVAYTAHLGPVRAAEAVERFSDGVFEIIREHPEELCVIKGITPARARAIHESFSVVASIANVDAWLRQLGLGKAAARRVREAYGDQTARLMRENPYRLADDILYSLARHEPVEAPDMIATCESAVVSYSQLTTVDGSPAHRHWCRAHGFGLDPYGFQTPDADGSLARVRRPILFVLGVCRVRGTRDW